MLRFSVSRSLSAFLLLLGILEIWQSPALAEPIWIEGESLAQPPAGFKSAGWGNKHYLSGGAWLLGNIEGKSAEALPREGLVLPYPFEAPAAGAHEVWARIGYEFARSPFRWRIDANAWDDNRPEHLTTDLMELAEWTEVAWIKLGTVNLAAGKHTLEIQFERRVLPGKKQPERILAGLDCFCITREPFRPNGPYPPGADWKTEADKKAAAQVFQAGAPATPRSVLALEGLWQIARWDEQEIQDRDQPVQELPADLDQLFWKGVSVPGNRDTARPDMLYCHRFLYRTRVHVPVERAGQSFVLHFPSTALLASVFVNGAYCGGNRTPCAAWEVDISRAIVTGKDNDVVVAIKDVYYAIEKTGDNKSVRTLFNYPTSWFYSGSHGGGATRHADFPVLLQVRGAGILETPTLIAAGAAYISDVFTMPSVARKDLALQITVRNAGMQPIAIDLQNEIVPAGGGKAEKTFAAQSVTIPAQGETEVRLAEKWDHPQFWWPEQPHLYEVVTRLTRAGKIIDERKTRFGFREWQWQGPHFTLNGVPWHFHADNTHNARIADKDRARVAAYWKKSGINTVRYWGSEPWIGTGQAETLDWYDTIGMPVRRSGIFDGQGANYNLVENKGGKNVARKALFDNWIHQLKAQVKAERNHPSIFVWSIENEITFINIRNLGLHDACEPQIRRAVQEVMALDPTRPAMIDGGDALRDKSLPIYGNHYNEAHFRHYPDEAYTMKLAYSRHKDPWTPWPLGDDKPLFLGESFFAAGHPPAAYSALMGEQAFLGRNQAEAGVHLFARMLAEGYRWHGLAGFHFWFIGNSPDNPHYQAFQPVCVFCRQWNWTFGGGESVERTLKVFNDTSSSEPIDVEWSFRVDGKAYAEGAETFALAPGTAREYGITLRTPRVPARTRGELVLTCNRGGAQVFRDVKPCVVLADLPGVPQLNVQQITVYDPKGVVQPWLKQRNYPFRAIASLDAVPAQVQVLIVGPDALTAREATDPRWVALAARGARVLVLDQMHPLHYQAVPADLTPTDFVGRMAFPENLEHPAFAGLGKEDFLCWSGDHVVYRNVYKKASRGARSLLQCDDELSCSALSECPVQNGVLVLAQTALGARLARKLDGTLRGDPVASRLLDNLIRYCLGYRLPARTTVTVFAEGDLRLKLLDSTGLKHTRAAGMAEALDHPGVEIIVADAAPANLAPLVKARDKLQAFHARGGSLMLWGLTPEGLSSFNQLVALPHVLRPFGMERVTLPAQRDPLLAGLTTRDVVLEGTERIYPWAGDRYPAKDTFTYVVDLDDIAPFARSAKHAHGWSQMTNGLTSADSWKFIFYQELKNDPHPRWSADFPHEEEVTDFSIVLNTHYQVISRLRLKFDDREEDAVTLELKGTPELKEEFTFKPRRCKRITLEPLALDPRGKTQLTTGVDNLWIKVRRSPEYHQRVVPLLNIGALVKYRMGQGGILLNQMRVLDNEPNPVNGTKKQNIVATLLRNLGATFAAERLLVAGANLDYVPLPLNEKCTQFLTAERGWIDGQPDLSHFPVGELKLAGVAYVIRDFKTSPLPACIMLAGPGAKGDLPRAVEGIAVQRKADVLFFLHTFHRTKQGPPPGAKNKPPPAVFRYVIHYADGKTAEAPVLLNQDVAHWLAAEPQGLPGAAVAWAAPLPKDPLRQAVVYQMSWTNPRPSVEIRSIDVRYDETVGNQYGIPIVLAITAGSANP